MEDKLPISQPFPQQNPIPSQDFIPPVPPQPKNKRKIIIFAAVGVFLILVLLAAFLYFWNFNSKSSSKIPQQVPSQFPTTTPTSIQVTTPTPVNENLNYYHLEIKLKDPKIEPPNDPDNFLINYLAKALGLPKAENNFQVIEKIVFDTREGYPWGTKNFSRFNFNYFIGINGAKLETKIYEDNYTTIKVNPVEERLVPYLKDPDYCEMDNDCTLRSNFCTSGSFNFYHQYVEVWGCEGMTDETNQSSFDRDQEMGCTTSVSYSGSKCENNKCIGQNRTVSCIETSQ
jgi:hypothetical protein